MSTNQVSRISTSRLHAFAVTAMAHCGMNEADACVTADVLVANDSMGVFTHGTKQLLNLLTKNMLTGRLNPKAAPFVEREGPAWVIVNGNAAMPMVTSVFAMRTAIAKARSAGIGYAGVHNSNHTKEEAFAEADLVLTCLGDPGGETCGVVANRSAANPRQFVTADDLAQLLADVASPGRPSAAMVKKTDGEQES